MKKESIGGLTREDLFSFARGGQEEIVAKHISRAGLDHLSRFSTQAEREFAFRCFWVPFEMVAVCERAFRSTKGRPFYLGQFALLVAHSRMLNEMCAWKQDPRCGWWPPHRVAEACRYWTDRYDSYLCAIGAAFQHWIKRRCPDCCHDQPALAAASRYGFIERIDAEGLPLKCLAEIRAKMKERGQVGSRESEFYHKHANPRGTSEPRWDHPDIDLWLMEIWPLVVQCDWTHSDIYQLLLAKFGDDDVFEKAGVLSSPATLKERCKKVLGLRLSSAAQQRRGRPKKCDDAADLTRFGQESFGKFAKRTQLPDKDVEARGPSAFQALADLAVNIEPFTRQLDCSSKELLSIACPRLKYGGKKGAVTPPFFVTPVP